MEHAPQVAKATAPAGDLARISGVLAFAEATGAPPEALAWLLRLSREAEARRAAGDRDVAPAALPPVLVEQGRG
jgi:hypothetical protein